MKETESFGLNLVIGLIQLLKECVYMLLLCSSTPTAFSMHHAVFSTGWNGIKDSYFKSLESVQKVQFRHCFTCCDR